MPFVIANLPFPPPLKKKKEITAFFIKNNSFMCPESEFLLSVVYKSAYLIP